MNKYGMGGLYTRGSGKEGSDYGLQKEGERQNKRKGDLKKSKRTRQIESSDKEPK